MRIFLLAVFLWSFLAGPARAEEKKSHLKAGVEFLNNGDYDASIENFQKAFADGDKNHAQIYNLLGLAYLKQGKSVKSAIGSFEEALKIDPGYAEVYFNLATAYAGPAANPALAAEYFNKTLEIDPHYSKAYFGLGWFTLMEKKDPVKSLEYFKKTIVIHPDFAEAHYAMGLAQIQMGEAPLALASISTLRGLNRNDLAASLEEALRKAESNAPASGGKPGEGGSAAPSGANPGSPGESPSAASPQAPPPAGAKRSPFDVLLKGKMNRPSNAASASPAQNK